jgi:hypothetical protein
MTLSEDNAVQIARRQCIDDKECFRKIKSDPAAILLDWEDDGFTTTGTSTITVKARRGSKALNARVKPEGLLRVIKANEPEKKTDAAFGIGRYLIQKVVRSQKFEKLMSKEKHGPTFASLENNLVSNKMLTHAKTKRSDAFFQFTITARADVLLTLTPATIGQWYQRPRVKCQRCDNHTKPT